MHEEIGDNEFGMRTGVLKTQPLAYSGHISQSDAAFIPRIEALGSVAVLRTGQRPDLT